MNGEFPKLDGHCLELDRECVDHAITRIVHTAPYFIPVYRAVRDHGVVLVELGRGKKFPSRPKNLRKRPLLLFIGDDLATAEGPEAFHTQSLRKVFGLADLVVIHASCPQEKHYQTFATNAAAGSNVVVVETQPDRLDEWCAFHKRHASKNALFLIIPPPDPRPGSAA